MKDIAIMTFNQAINYGAVFQMYALQKTVNKLGASCDIINYQSAPLSQIYRKRTVKDWMTPKKLYSVFFHNSYIKYNYDGFAKFLSERIQLSEIVYHNYNELLSANEQYRKFIAGSDQVFNLFCCSYDENYFLPFVQNSDVKYSYAASLGLSEIPRDLEETYKRLLSGFKKLSIREKTGAHVLHELLGKECQVHLDPTLLLDKEEWHRISVPYKVPEKYILVYLLSEDKELFTYAKRLAKKNKCEIIYINDRLIPQIGMENKRRVNPDEWLTLFGNASAIVTNSYHGLLFSINFNKTVYPFLLNRNDKINSRAIDFLEVLDLSHLLTENYRERMAVGTEILNGANKQLLALEKERSIAYIKNIIDC